MRISDWSSDVCSSDLNVPVTPEVKETIWTALGSLASAPREERTMTGLALLLQSNALRIALQPYTLDGPHGRLLDAAEQNLALADVQCFEPDAPSSEQRRFGKACVSSFISRCLPYLLKKNT